MARYWAQGGVHCGNGGLLMPGQAAVHDFEYQFMAGEHCWKRGCVLFKRTLSVCYVVFGSALVVASD